MDTPHDKALLNLSKAVRDPDFRRDQDGTLKKHGVDKKLIRPDVFTTLATLSDDELTVLAKVNGALTDEKVTPHVKAEWV